MWILLEKNNGPALELLLPTGATVNIIFLSDLMLTLLNFKSHSLPPIFKNTITQITLTVGSRDTKRKSKQNKLPSFKATFCDKCHFGRPKTN